MFNAHRIVRLCPRLLTDHDEQDPQERVRHAQLALAAHGRHAAAMVDPIGLNAPARHAAERHAATRLVREAHARAHHARARLEAELHEQAHPAVERRALVMRVLVPTAGAPIRDRVETHVLTQASSVHAPHRGR